MRRACILRDKDATVITRVRSRDVMTMMIEFALLVLGKRLTCESSQMRGRLTFH